MKQNLGRPKERQPVGILRRVEQLGYQLRQIQGEPSKQIVIQISRKISVLSNRTVQKRWATDQTDTGRTA